MNRRPFLLYTAMVLGYAFLYIPIVSVIVYSFNASRVATVWGGFSTWWYVALLDAVQLLDAMQRSFVIATATAAVMLGTACGLALSRFGKFPGRGLLSLMNSTPMVMPDVMMGLSSLLLFVTLQQAFGWPDRGMVTITLAHITLTACYVTVVVKSRMAGTDDSLEEAAMDLGARPWRVFFVITLPLIAPALLADWLLAFTLSLDDLVIASFTSGPGPSTLPMVVYSKVKLGVTPEINALATMIVVLVAVGVNITGILMHRRRPEA